MVNSHFIFDSTEAHMLYYLLVLPHYSLPLSSCFVPQGTNPCGHSNSFALWLPAGFGDYGAPVGEGEREVRVCVRLLPHHLCVSTAVWQWLVP